MTDSKAAAVGAQIRALLLSLRDPERAPLVFATDDLRAEALDHAGLCWLKPGEMAPGCGCPWSHEKPEGPREVLERRLKDHAEWLDLVNEVLAAAKQCGGGHRPGCPRLEVFSSDCSCGHDDLAKALEERTDPVTDLSTQLREQWTSLLIRLADDYADINGKDESDALRHAVDELLAIPLPSSTPEDDLALIERAQGLRVVVERSVPGNQDEVTLFVDALTGKAIAEVRQGKRVPWIGHIKSAAGIELPESELGRYGDRREDVRAEVLEILNVRGGWRLANEKAAIRRLAEDADRG